MPTSITLDAKPSPATNSSQGTGISRCRCWPSMSVYRVPYAVEINSRRQHRTNIGHKTLMLKFGTINSLINRLPTPKRASKLATTPVLTLALALVLTLVLTLSSLDQLSSRALRNIDLSSILSFFSTCTLYFLFFCVLYFCSSSSLPSSSSSHSLIKQRLYITKQPPALIAWLLGTTYVLFPQILFSSLLIPYNSMTVVMAIG